MSQSLYFVALHLLGLAVAWAMGLGKRRALCCAAAFLIGQAVFVLAGLGLLVVGLPYFAGSAVAIVAVAVAVSIGVIVRRGDVERADVRFVLSWTAGFSVVSVALSSINLSLLARDSHWFVALGNIIADDGALSEGSLGLLQSWGVFQPIALSPASFVGQEYLYSSSPHVAVSLLVFFGVALREAHPEAKGAWVVGLTLCLGSVFHFNHHFLFIHNNLGTAAYLFGFVALFWLAERDRDPSALGAAFICLAALAFERVETPICALLFAAIACVPSRLPRRRIAVGLGGFCLAVATWYLVLAAHAPETGRFLTTSRCYLVVGLVVATYSLWALSSRPPLARLAPYVPEVALGLCGIGLVVAFALKPMHMATSMKAWLRNLVSGYWGLTWPFIALLALLSTRLPRPSGGKLFTFGAASYLAFVLLLPFGRTPYRIRHVGDSGNRMMLHLLPLLMYYFGLKLLTRERAAADAPAGGAERSALRPG